MGDINTILLNLLEARLTLYAEDASGAPVTANPIIADINAENLGVRERWLKTTTTPTGARFPRKHPLLPEYELTIGRVWTLALENLAGYQTSNRRFTLDIVWQEETGEGWHRATFYGVTISESSNENRDVDGGFYEGFVFDAEYYVPAGGSGSAPALTSELPYTVRYVSGTENTLLYTYDFASRTFTAAESTAGRATITRDGSNNVAVKFDGHAANAFAILASDVTTRVTQVVIGAPRTSDFPLLAFYRGSARLATITEKGRLFIPDGWEVQAPDQDAGFLFGDPTDPAAKFLTGGEFKAIEEFYPGDVPDLTAWYRADTIPVGDGATFTGWRDESSDQYDLASTGAPRKLLVDGGPAVEFQDGQWFGRPGTLVNTAALTLFIVARRERGVINRPLLQLGDDTNGSLTWLAGPKQMATLPDGGGIAMAGTLFDENKFRIYELEKSATGTNLRLDAEPDVFQAHGAFGAVKPITLGGRPQNPDLTVTGLTAGFTGFNGTYVWNGLRWAQTGGAGLIDVTGDLWFLYDIPLTLTYSNPAANPWSGTWTMFPGAGSGTPTVTPNFTCWNGHIRDAMIFERNLTAGECDQVRMWLRTNYNLP